KDEKQVAAGVEFLTSQGGKCCQVKAHITPVSSTFLRGEIGKNCDVGEFLNPEVWQYIQKYHIYSADYYERNIGTARALVPLLLKEKRASHTFNVEKLAVELAHRYSLCEKKARLCALLHDIMKEADEDILLHRAYQSDIINKIPEKPLPLLHGFAAADYAMKELGITDGETLWALRSHTCARVGMCDMEKVIYLADMLCEERDFAQKDYLLSCTFKNLDFAMKEALKASISWISSKGGRVDRDSVDALEYFEGL
ncbi:MAG: bis(5'-nucleosyl)-tetraphosphatase (symmetrical) YqeK, partial [Oscillospiraceae bacterium]